MLRVRGDDLLTRSPMRPIRTSLSIFGLVLATAVCAAAELFIPLGELVDLDKERKRLQKDQEQLTREIARAEGKLQNPGFIEKAPPALIDEERQKLET